MHEVQVYLRQTEAIKRHFIGRDFSLVDIRYLLRNWSSSFICIRIWIGRKEIDYGLILNKNAYYLQLHQQSILCFSFCIDMIYVYIYRNVHTYNHIFGYLGRSHALSLVNSAADVLLCADVISFDTHLKEG